MTQDQAKTGEVLEALGFEMSPGGMPGSDSEYPVTAALAAKFSEGKSIVVGSDGVPRFE